MKRWTVAAVAGIALACAAGALTFAVARRARAQELARLGARVDSLVARFEAGPTTSDPAQEGAALVRRWQELEREFGRLDARVRRSGQYERRVGELYELGYRMDVPDTWEKAQSHLKRALELAADDDDARLDLARLYVNSDLALAGEAGRLFRIVRERGSEPQRKIALRGLVFAYWYQGDCTRALAVADSALRELPAQRDLAETRDMLAGMGCGSPQARPEGTRAAPTRTARDRMLARVDARRWAPLFVEDSAAVRYDRTRVMRLRPGLLRLWVRLDFLAPTPSRTGRLHNAELAEWEVDCERRWLRFVVVAEYFDDTELWRGDDSELPAQDWLRPEPGSDSETMVRTACCIDGSCRAGVTGARVQAPAVTAS